MGHGKIIKFKKKKQNSVQPLRCSILAPSLGITWHWAEIWFGQGYVVALNHLLLSSEGLICQRRSHLTASMFTDMVDEIQRASGNFSQPEYSLIWSIKHFEAGRSDQRRATSLLFPLSLFCTLSLPRSLPFSGSLNSNHTFPSWLQKALLSLSLTLETRGSTKAFITIICCFFSTVSKMSQSMFSPLLWCNIPFSLS